MNWSIAFGVKVEINRKEGWLRMIKLHHKRYGPRYWRMMLRNKDGYSYLAYVPLKDAEQILKGKLDPIDWLVHKGFTVATVKKRYKPKGREPKKCFLGRENVSVYLPNGRILYGPLVLARMKRGRNYWQLYVREGPHYWKRVRYVPQEQAEQFIKHRRPEGAINWLCSLGYKAHLYAVPPPATRQWSRLEDEGMGQERIDRMEDGTLIESFEEALEYGDSERARDLLGDSVAEAVEVLEPRTREDWELLERLYGKEAVEEEREYRRKFSYPWEEEEEDNYG